MHSQVAKSRATNPVPVDSPPRWRNHPQALLTNHIVAKCPGKYRGARRQDGKFDRDWPRGVARVIADAITHIRTRRARPTTPSQPMSGDQYGKSCKSGHCRQCQREAAATSCLCDDFILESSVSIRREGWIRTPHGRPIMRVEENRNLRFQTAGCLGYLSRMAGFRDRPAKRCRQPFLLDLRIHFEMPAGGSLSVSMKLACSERQTGVQWPESTRTS